MDKKTKIFFLVFFGLIAVVIAITYGKYFILKDYYIEAEADCDPAVEACFVTTCDPADDSECPEDESERTSYTEIVRKKAYDIPLCDPNDENCDALKCESGQDCVITLCDESMIGEGQECSDPETYIEENSTDEESEETGTDKLCAPDDTECLESGGEPDSAEDSREDDAEGLIDSADSDITTDEIAPADTTDQNVDKLLKGMDGGVKSDKKE